MLNVLEDDSKCEQIFKAIVDYIVSKGEDIDIEVKAGTQPGDRIRLKNKGMRYMSSERRGDLYVQFNVVIPTKLTDTQKECLKKFEEEASEEEKSFWSKIFS